MIIIKDEQALRKMRQAGKLVARILHEISDQLVEGVSTLQLDTWIEQQLRNNNLVSQSKGYQGYKHVSCISVNDEVVHGIPKAETILKQGDLVTVDVCAAWHGYCADSARSFVVDGNNKQAQMLIEAANLALNAGIEQAIVGAHLSNISAAIQTVVECKGFGVLRDFCGHGIGKKMHEEPEILNYGVAGHGPLLKAGMALAIEPMITVGDYRVKVMPDKWTVATLDGSLAAHVEDTVLITPLGPEIITQYKG